VSSAPAATSGVTVTVVEVDGVDMVGCGGRNAIGGGGLGQDDR
jgi:hypothetical protein